MQNFILYIAHTDLGYINECRFSLLKFLSVYNLKPPADTAVVIYTDHPALFENFIPFFYRFEIEEVTGERIKEWKGEKGYIHRAKLKMTQDFFSKYTGNLLFFDTDTYITSPIQDIWKDIEAGGLYMHQCEGVIDQKQNPEFKKWDTFLQKAEVWFGGKKFMYSPQFQIWNSGVLGLHSSYAQLMEDIILLTDSIYQQFPKHITDQVAWSYCLQSAGTIKSAQKQVKHYWNLKEFRNLLHLFFKKNEEESIPNQVKAAYHIDAAAIQQQKEVYKKLPFYKKWLAAVTGSKWTIQQYQKKI
jgi:hypothetical protein